MFLKNITAITFDPVKEKHIMEKFMEENDMTEWVEHQATVGITFTRTVNYMLGYERGEEHVTD